MSQFLYKKIITENYSSFSYFFQRPLIKRGMAELKKIWSDGGKSNASLLHKYFKQKRSLFSVVITEIIQLKVYKDFIENNNNYKHDLTDQFFKFMFIYLNGEGTFKDNLGKSTEYKFTKSELNDVYKVINEYRLQVFVESLLKFQREVNKHGKNKTS